MVYTRYLALRLRMSGAVPLTPHICLQSMGRDSFILSKLGSVGDIMLPSAGEESVGLATSETLTLTFHGCQHTNI